MSDLLVAMFYWASKIVFLIRFIKQQWCYERISSISTSKPSERFVQLNIIPQSNHTCGFNKFKFIIKIMVTEKKVLDLQIFEALQKHASSMGIDSYQLKQNRRFGLKSLKFLSVLGILSMFSDLHFICIASTFEEYTRSFYIASMSNTVFVIFGIVIWRMKFMFQFIDDVGRFVSEWTIVIRIPLIFTFLIAYWKFN